LERGERWDPSHEVLVMISDGPHATLRVNGSATPPPRELHVGTSYRIRLADIAIYQQNLMIRLVRDSSVVPWRALAKDGFTLPPQQATIRPGSVRVASGETADFELIPGAPGDLKLEIDRAGPFAFHAALLLHVH